MWSQKLRFPRTPSFLRHRTSPDHSRTQIGHRDIEHAQLHALGALPAIDGERARHMQDLAAMCRQRVPQFLTDRAERDAVDNSAIARLKAHAQMRLTDF